MKPRLFTKINMINRSMEVAVCLYEKYEKMLFCVTLSKWLSQMNLHCMELPEKPEPSENARDN